MRYVTRIIISISRPIVVWSHIMRFDDNLCPRCGGLFVQDYPDHDGLQLWGCLNCGCKMDDTIWFHQQIDEPESLCARHNRLEREWQQACLLAVLPSS